MQIQVGNNNNNYIVTMHDQTNIFATELNINNNNNDNGENQPTYFYMSFFFTKIYLIKFNVFTGLIIYNTAIQFNYLIYILTKDNSNNKLFIDFIDCF